MDNLMTVSSREFNQDISAAKRAAIEGPVIITDRGKPAHVLLSMEHYQSISSPRQSMVDLLAMPVNDESAQDIEFEPAKLDSLYGEADLSD